MRFLDVMDVPAYLRSSDPQGAAPGGRRLQMNDRDDGNDDESGFDPPDIDNDEDNFRFGGSSQGSGFGGSTGVQPQQEPSGFGTTPYSAPPPPRYPPQYPPQYTPPVSNPAPTTQQPYTPPPQRTAAQAEDEDEDDEALGGRPQVEELEDNDEPDEPAASSLAARAAPQPPAAVPTPPAVPILPKGAASQTANTGFYARAPASDSVTGIEEQAQGGAVRRPPEQPKSKKRGKQVAKAGDEEEDDGAPAAPRKGQASVTAMTSLTGVGSPAPKPPAVGMAAPPGAKQMGESPKAKADKSPAKPKAPTTPSPRRGKKEDDDDEQPEAPAKVAKSSASPAKRPSLPPPPTRTPAPPVFTESVAQDDEADDVPDEPDEPVSSQRAAGRPSAASFGTSPPEDQEEASLFAASDDPDGRLTANGEGGAQGPSVAGSRTENAEVQPFSADGESLGAPSSPGLVPPSFGAVIADEDTGLGSGFTGKADDGLVGEDENDGPDTDEAKELTVVVDGLEHFSRLLQLNSSGSKEGRKLVVDLSKSLEDMRYRLDATYTKSSFSLWSKMDVWWWKCQYGLQDIEFADSCCRKTAVCCRYACNCQCRVCSNGCRCAQGAAPEPSGVTGTACSLAEVADEVRAELSDQDMPDELLRLNAPKAKFEELAEGCGDDELPEQTGEESFGHLIKIVVSAVNESVREVYPMQLNGTFAAEHNQSWVEIVAQRSSRWNEIRAKVSNVSLVGYYVDVSLRGMLRTLPFVAVPGFRYPAGPPPPVSSEEMEPGLEALGSLLDDLTGVTVAIHEGNYTLKSLQTTKDKRGLDDWQRGPVRPEDVKDAVDRAVLKARAHPALIGNPQQLVVDGVVGVVLHSIGIMEAKVFNRTSSVADLPPPPQGGSILNLLSSIETLMEGWVGYELARGRIHESNVFGSESAMKASLDLAGCLALGGTGDDECSSIELPFSGERCGMREPDAAASPVPGSLKAPERLCMPPKAHQLSTVKEHLREVPEDNRDGLADGVSELFEAAAVCASRSEAQCGGDDMCNATIFAPGAGRLRVCQLGDSFANRIIDEKNVLGLVGRNKSCVEYLGRPKCTLMSKGSSCAATEKCIWQPAGVRIKGQGHRSANVTSGEEGKGNGSKGAGRLSSQLVGTGGTEEDGNGSVDGPGYCVDDWLVQMEGVVGQEGPPALMVKHTECKAQHDSENCRVVDASRVDLSVSGTATIPDGGSSDASKVIALGVSVGGTLLFAAVLAVAWKVVRRHRAGTDALKPKKGSGGCGKKGATRRLRLPGLPRFLRFSMRAEPKCKASAKGGKGGKGGKGDTKVPMENIRDWRQPAVMPFVTTSIMIQEASEAPAPEAKAKDMNDFGFVLSSIHPSEDSRRSEAPASSRDGRGRSLGPITSEIEVARQAGRAEGGDSECESPWSGSSAWSDDEPEVPAVREDWNPLPESLYRHRG
ncbi:unnamed protein product [Ostreobium quekettii]|uniref:Uncharacterized protein n=1 Tax=Ostreobium quekettii TaxID=121088 RepID=A0A8S1JEP3_9CHLO|nr:unnamed protein product [Ostreobium quekettii]